MRVAGTIAFCAAFGVVGCSLFVSLDGLSDGAADVDGGDASLDGDANTGDVTQPTDSSNPGDGSLVFLDDFNRPDAALIGNGWIEKRPIAFSLGGDQVVRGTVDSVDYPDNMVYRPSSEDIGDSEVSVELIFQTSITGYPQLHSRIQSDTVIQAGTVDSYLLYIPMSATTATLSRTRGPQTLSDFTTFNLSETLTTGQRYRLRLRILSTGPVLLFGFVDHFEGGTWTTIGQGTATDSDPMQLDDAGSAGFSCSANDVDLYHYDNFMRTPL